MTTTLSYQPGLVNSWQKGEIWGGANPRVEVPGTLIAGVPSTFTTMVANLDTKMKSEIAAHGNIRVYGHSNGGQLIYKWLREYGPTSTIDPATVQFISAANPEQKFNGYCKASTGYNMYGGNGFPQATPYHIIDFARQYDVYADYPNDENNLESVMNVGQGGIRPNILPILGPGFWVHLDYFNVGLSDPANLTHVDGNCTYILSPTDPPPMIAAWPEFIRPPKFKAMVEAGYQRPFSTGGGSTPNIAQLDVIEAQVEEFRREQ
jgi:hypothetical protein